MSGLFFRLEDMSDACLRRHIQIYFAGITTADCFLCRQTQEDKDT